MPKRADAIVRRLLAAYPEPKLELEYRTPLELLVAVLLSAQCTDARVNQVTRELFRKYRTAADYAKAPLERLEQEIRPTGFYRNKAKRLKECCAQLVERYGGKVPRDPDKLAELPGVGRKTANMVAGNAFGIPAIAVDTHVLRVSQRLGLAPETRDPDKVEAALREVVPRERWTEVTNALILHGRRVCKARRPDCEGCDLAELCPSAGETTSKTARGKRRS
ncbi:MAG: endonuclease III [Acidobacteria bacterium]|nr:MAG: endonuclease III [Acidobacteriota bacterium]